jgi:hypothetical protein
MRVNRLAIVVAALLALAGGAAGPSRAVESTRLVVTCTWPGDPSPEVRRTTLRRTGTLAAALYTASREFTPVQHRSARTRRIEYSLFQRPPPDND